MKRFVISLYLLLVACDTPILHACDEGPLPSFVTGGGSGEVPVFDLTGRVDMDQLSQVLDIMLAFSEQPKEVYDGLRIGFVPDPIPWDQHGGTAMGYYAPDSNYIEVVYSSDMDCLLDTAIVHELGHKMEYTVDALPLTRLDLEQRAQAWLLSYGRICL